MSAFSPRPYAPTGICCPACDHGIDLHTVTSCQQNSVEGWCRCQWTPNDIAYWLLFGGLTNPVGSVATLEPRDV